MSGTVQTRIADARVKARMLYNELDKVKSEIRDATLQQCGSNINLLPRGVCDLKLYNTLKGHQNKIVKFVWNSDSSRILSSSQDGYMIIWDAVTGLKKELIALDNQWVLTCAFSPDEKLIASGGLDNACTIYRLHPPQDIATESGYSMFGVNHHSLLSVFKGHTAYISDNKFLSNTNLVTSSGDMTCALWDITKGGKVSSFNDHLGDVLTLDIMDNKDPHLFISGSSDGYVNIWDIRQPLPAQNIFITNSDVSSIKMFNDGNSFVSGSDDGIIRLIDLRSDCELNSFNLLNDGNFLMKNAHLTNSRNSVNSANSYDIPAVMSVDISKSYRLLYASYADYGCIIWDTVKNEVVGNIDTSAKTNQVSVSTDGLAVATASWDSNIRIWSV